MSKNIRYGLFPVSFILVALLSTFFIAVPVSATGGTAPSGPITVQQGAVFLLRGSITFDKASAGEFSYGPVYWYSYGNENENFRLENTPSVYWSNGTPVENVSISDYAIPDGWQIDIRDNGGGNLVIWPNGTFYVDIWLRAEGYGGILHAPENQDIYFAMDQITIWEPGTVVVPAPAVTIEVTALSRGVDVSASPSLQTGWTDDNLVYNVKVQNTGSIAENFYLDLDEVLGWPHEGIPDNAYFSWASTTVADTGVIENRPNENRLTNYNNYVGYDNGNPTGGYLTERMYLKFDLSSIPAGALITSAVENLMGRYGPSHYPSNTADNMWVEAWSVTGAGTYYSADNWTETENVCWVRRPADGALGTLLDNVYWVASAFSAPYTRYYWNVLPFVQSEFAGDKIATFVMTSMEQENPATRDGDTGWFYTRNNTPAENKPYLNVSGYSLVISLNPGDNWNGQIWVVVAGLPGDIDNLTVTAKTMDNAYSDSATVQAKHAVAGVDVTIDPPSKSGMGDTTFTVTVKNTGELPDNYTLENIGTENWALWLNDNVLGPIENGGSMTTTLHVDIPNLPGTTDNVTVKATSVHDNTVSDNATCQALAGAVELYNENNNFVNGYTNIQPAIDDASTGWKVLVHPGTFNENLYVNKENLKIISTDGAEVTIIDAGGTENGVKIVADGVTFGGFTVTNGGLGIQLWYSNNNLIENNIAENNTWVGIELYFSDNNRIENNNCENNDYGIELGYSDINIVSNNTAGNNIYGIYLWDSYNNLIENNIAGNNIYGINIRFSSNNNIVENNIAENNDYGFYIYESDNNRIENNTANNNSFGIYLENSDNNTLDNNTCENNINFGIWLESSGGCALDNNTCENNVSYGIFVSDSSKNTISNNTSENNHQHGIHLFHSDNNIIDNCILENNDHYGIFLSDSSNNNLIQNCISENNGDSGIYLDKPSDNNRVIGCTASNNTNYGIWLESSENSIIENNNCENNNYGIYLGNSHNNTLENNTCENNYYGVYLDYSDNNTLIYNTLTGNDYGFYVYYSNNNQIDNNTILATTWSNFGSCPFLYTWNGTGMKFLGDINGPGGLGYRVDMSMYGGGIGLRPPTGIDYTAIDSSDLVPKDGSYVLEVAEDQDEITYLDNAELWVIDHSPDVEVYSPEASLGTNTPYLYPPVIHTVRNPVAPVSATDWKGNDILPVIVLPDGVYTEAEPLTDSFITLNLGDLSGASQIKLIYRGYTDFSPIGTVKAYPYAEVKNASGEWELVSETEHLGIPAAMPKTYVIDITNWFKTNDWRLRLHTGTLKINVDWIAVDTSVDEPVNVTVLKPTSANHYYKGPDHPGFEYFFGNFTRYGDVLPLLQGADDKFVIMRAGDSVELKFAAQPAPAGERDFMLVTDAYFKQPFVKYLLGSKISTVDPLPFHGMSNYPYPSSESYPSDAEHLAYLSEWNTREYGEGGAGMSLPYSDNNTVFGNTIIGSYYGLLLDHETNTRILKNTISNTYDGIYLYSSENCIVDNNIVENNSDSGIYFDSSENDNLTNNTCENNINYGIWLESSENCVIDGCTASNNGDYGIYVVDSYPVTIRNNVIENNDHGIVFSGVILNTTVVIENNLIQACTEWGIDFYNEVDYTENSQITIQNNRIINNPNTYAIDLDTPHYSSDIMILGNTIDNNGYEGIYWDIIQDSEVLIENNLISNNGDEGIYFDSDICGDSNIMVNNNSISKNGSYGIYFGYIYDNSMIGIVGNMIDNNGDAGIYFEDDYEIYGNSTLTIGNNSISNNYYQGIYFGYWIYDNAVVTITGNTIDNNDSEGIYFEYEIYGNSSVQIGNNSISNNDSEGIYFDDYIEDNAMITITGNTIDNNYWEGIYFWDPIEDNSIIMIGNNSISNNGAYGIDFDDDVKGNSVVGIVGNTIENNVDEGVDFDHVYENSMVGIIGNTIDNNGYGFYIEDDIEAPFIIFFNNITNNVTVDSGVHVYSGIDIRGLMMSFNNIVGNSPSENTYGVYSDVENLNARYNWWGHASGPGGVGPGTGDKISENVLYRPWIPEPFEDVVVGFGGDYISENHNDLKLVLENLDFAPIQENVAVSMDSTENGLLVATMFKSIGGAPIPAGLKSALFMDISTITENIAENFQITVHYTDGDISGIDESSLKLYYWSSTDSSWHLCNNITVNTAANTVSGSIGHLTPFGIFGVPAAPPTPPTPPAPPKVGVSVSISPSTNSALPGESINYTVTVMNTGDATDTFDLHISGGTGWSPSISMNSITLNAGTSSGVTLTVTVPSGAAAGASTTITVTATSRADPSVSNSASCRATASVLPPGPGPTPTPTGISWGAILTIAGAIVIIILLLILILFFEK